jgi:hypothetical protein
MSHVAGWREVTDVSTDQFGREQERVSMRPIVALDFVVALAADMTASPPRPIQPGDVLSLIRLLMKRHFSIEVVSCDWYGLPTTRSR